MSSAARATAGVSENRHIGEFHVSESMLLVTVPPPPEDLNSEGTRWWNYYCGLFVEGQMLSRFFITAIHNLCTLHMVRQWIKDELKAAGSIIHINHKTVRDEVITNTTMNPLVRELRQCIIDMDRLLASLGMTVPTSKAQNINTSGEGPRQRSKPPQPFSPENGSLDDDYEVISMTDVAG